MAGKKIAATVVLLLLVCLIWGATFPLMRVAVKHPLLVNILGPFFLPGERLTLRKAVALALGLAGLGMVAGQLCYCPTYGSWSRSRIV